MAGVLVGRRERLAGPLARTGMGPTRRTENGRADAEPARMDAEGGDAPASPRDD